VVVVEESKELFSGELLPVVCYDGVRYSESMKDVQGELHRLFRLDSNEGLSLDPIGELVDGDERVGETTRHLLERPEEVEAPDRKGPYEWDRLKSLRGLMYLAGVVLAALTRTNESLGVSHRGGPVSHDRKCF